MYAEDTNLTASGSSIPEIKTMLDKDIECLVEWLCANKLTYVIFCGSQNSRK